MTDGDVLTFDGLFKPMPNPNRRWWQLWKPRTIASNELQTFVVKGSLAFADGEFIHTPNHTNGGIG